MHLLDSHQLNYSKYPGIEIILVIADHMQKKKCNTMYMYIYVLLVRKFHSYQSRKKRILVNQNKVIVLYIYNIYILTFIHQPNKSCQH